MGAMRNANTILTGKPQGKRPRRRPRRKWENNRTDSRETGSEVVDWIHMVQDRSPWRALVNTVMNLQVP